MVLPPRGHGRDHPDQRRAGLHLGRGARGAVRRRARRRARRGVRRRPRRDGAREAPVKAAAGIGDDVSAAAGLPRAPAFLRRPYGPGWALVGDAGYFKDPLTAHGITDALRDAELLARAAVDGSPTSFARYETDRDALARPLVEVAERIAAYDWDLTDVEDLLRAESAAMRPEVAVVRAFGQSIRTPQAA